MKRNHFVPFTNVRMYISVIDTHSSCLLPQTVPRTQRLVWVILKENGQCARRKTFSLPLPKNTSLVDRNAHKVELSCRQQRHQSLCTDLWLQVWSSKKGAQWVQPTYGHVLWKTLSMHEPFCNGSALDHEQSAFFRIHCCAGVGILGWPNWITERQRSRQTPGWVSRFQGTAAAKVSCAWLCSKEVFIEQPDKGTTKIRRFHRILAFSAEALHQIFTRPFLSQQLCKEYNARTLRSIWDENSAGRERGERNPWNPWL